MTEDGKFHNYLRKVTAVYQDISVSLFNNFCDQNNNDDDMKKLFFNLAYCWLKAGSHLMYISEGSFQIRHWNAQSDYLLRFVAFYIGPKDDRTLRTLTPQEFLFCMVVAGSHRRLPGLNYHGKEFESKHTSFRIPKKIEDFFVLHYDEFNTFEIGFLVQALHMANIMPYNKLHDRLFTTLMNLKNKEIIDADVANLLKILVKSDRNPQMGKSVMLKLLPILNELTVPATVRLCVLLHVHCLEESGTVLEPLVNSVRNKIDLFRVKDLFQLAFFLAELDAHTTGSNIVWKQGLKDSLSPEKELFYDELMLKATNILEKSSTHIHDSRHFISFVFQMSRLSYYSNYVIDKLIRTVNETKSLNDAQDGDEMLTNGALELFFKLRGKHDGFQRKINTDGYQILAKRKHAHALKNILELDFRLDRIGRTYKGARLNADLRIKLKHLVGNASAIGRIQSNSLNENLDDKFNT